MKADFETAPLGPTTQVSPRTASANRWLEDHAGAERWEWSRGAVEIDANRARHLMFAAVNAGFTVH